MERRSSTLWFPSLGTRAPSAIELCSGMGAIGIGLRSIGFNVVRAYDSWEAAVKIYNHNAPEPVATVTNLVHKRGLQRVVDDCRGLDGIDLLASGPPCKGFSQIRNGKHHERNPHNRVLASIPSYVAALRPRYVLIENVPDLARHNRGRTLKAVLAALAAPGPRSLRYDVDFNVYDAACYGTPQARRRMLILCVRSDAGKARLPEPGPDLALLYAAIRHGKKVPEEFEEYRAKLSDPSDFSLTSARQALGDLPLLEAGQSDEPRRYAAKAKSAFQAAMRQGAGRTLADTRTPAVRRETLRRLKLIPPGGCARDIPKRSLNGLARRYDSAYRRLHPEAPSTALSTKYDCVYHYARARSLSVREYARIQGLPDFVTFPAADACRRSAYEMIGNSVPPLLVREILGAALA